LGPGINIKKLTRPGAYPRGEHLKDTRKASVLLENSRFDWKGLPETNTLTYFASSHFNGTAFFKNCLNININTHVETPGGKSSNVNLNVFHFFSASVN
jgi:hypothetical protein